MRSRTADPLAYRSNDAGCPILATSLFLSLGWETSNLSRPASRNLSGDDYGADGRTRTCDELGVGQPI